jgi:hypothetical protein
LNGRLVSAGQIDHTVDLLTVDHHRLDLATATLGSVPGRTRGPDGTLRADDTPDRIDQTVIVDDKQVITVKTCPLDPSTVVPRGAGGSYGSHYSSRTSRPSRAGDIPYDRALPIRELHDELPVK